jgi:hypothetical protein
MGYYCLAERDDVLRQHARLLHDAGIDFVIIDSTNHSDQAGAEAMISKPFEELLKVWGQLPYAPKIVPWVPITGSGTMANYLQQQLTANPKLAFIYQGKPLFLALARRSDVLSPQFAAFQRRYTVRLMDGLLKPEQLRAGIWSFLQPCVAGFKKSGGNLPCRQGVTYRNGAPEQISATAAYQTSYMSDSFSAVPKFRGKTLLRQLETAYEIPAAPIVTITGWNEWIAQRVCPQRRTNCDETSDSLPNGNKVFTDQYDAEYNRDLEPGGGMGDYYYRLMRRAIGLLRSGRDPIAALE